MQRAHSLHVHCCEKSANYCPSHTPHGSLGLNTLPPTFPSLLPSVSIHPIIHHSCPPWLCFFLRKGKDQHQKREESLFEAFDLQTFGTMAETTQTQEQVSLKLLVNKESNKVIFAEAGKDFVDVLCSLLTLPLGTIVRLLQKDSNMEPVTVGCLNSLYQSVVDLDKECMSSETCKEMLLQPGNSSKEYCCALKLNIDDSQPTKYFQCWHCYGNNLQDHNCVCQKPLAPHFLKHLCNGFINGVATFVITDDLIVMPNSMDNTSFSLLQNSGIRSTSSVTEMTVNITKEKVLDLLKCAFISKSPLTDLFLGKNPSLERSRFFFCDIENNIDIAITVKLVVRKSDGKVLYAQGDKDFTDLLLSFITFPLGGVLRLLEGNCSLGSIDSLYKSIADLNESEYFISKEEKNRLVDPHVAAHFNLSNQLLPIQEPLVSFYCYYRRESLEESLRHNDFFISRERNNEGFNCKGMYLVNKPRSLTGSPEGYVKRPRTYMATDDLVIAPASPISTLHLINHSETPVNDLKEKVVTIGAKECLSILKASLTSTSALTNGLRHLLTEVKEEK